MAHNNWLPTFNKDMDAAPQKSEIDIIIDRIKHLYPDLKVEGIIREENKDYIVTIEHEEKIPGSSSVQRWKVEKGKAVFVGAYKKKEPS